VFTHRARRGTNHFTACPSNDINGTVMLATEEFKLLGSSLLLIPVALCLSAWMWAGNARRMAVTWALLFTAGLALVAASKMAYIGWGMAVDAIHFRGISGHAMRSTAVAPVLFYLLLHDARPGLRTAGILCGLGAGAVMAVAVSVFDEHSASEAVAGLLLGAAISLGFIRFAGEMRKPALDRPRVASLSVCSVLAVAAAMSLDSDPSSVMLESAALFLAGKDKPYHRHAPSTAQSPAGS